MARYFCDYFWKDGVPTGKGVAQEHDPLTYRILVDPYRKHFSVEKYEAGKFCEVMYDSILLDFRHLTPVHQTAWQKIPVGEQSTHTTHLIRNQDDRIVYLETCFFENEFCRRCEVSTPNGYLLSTHHMFYESLGDAFNGVVFVDRHQRPVMRKRYKIADNGIDFTDLIDQQWDMKEETLPSIKKAGSFP